LTVIFAVSAVLWWTLSLDVYAEPHRTITSPRGTYFFLNDVVYKRCAETIRYLEKNTEKTDRVIIIPEACGISFFSERKNPLKYYEVVPPIVDGIGENQLISQFSQSQADYIVMTRFETSLYGRASFGIDYAIKLNEWIKENYELVKLIGPYPFTSSEFGIAILKKKGI
jgi:hypothetical protein